MQRLMDLGGFAPPTIMEQVQRLLLVNDGAHNLVISNVPGPSRAAVPARAAAASRCCRRARRRRTTTSTCRWSPTTARCSSRSAPIPDVVPDGAGFAADLEASFAELHDAAAAVRHDRARPRSSAHGRVRVVDAGDGPAARPAPRPRRQLAQLGGEHPGAGAAPPRDRARPARASGAPSRIPARDDGALRRHRRRAARPARDRARDLRRQLAGRAADDRDGGAPSRAGRAPRSSSAPAASR